MDTQIILTKEELNEIIDSALKRCVHDSPSKETMKMMETLHDALFGKENENGKLQGGLVSKTDEMYEIFVVGKSGTIFLKFLVWGIISIGVIISAVKGLER